MWKSLWIVFYIAGCHSTMKTSGVGNLKCSIQQKKNGGMRMTMEEYKELIFLLVQSSYDIDYIIAVYLFAVSYPDKTREA